MVCFFIGLAGCVTLVVFGVCCSGLLLAGVHADAGVWFWYFGVVTVLLVVVDSGSLLILVLLSAGGFGV